MADVVRDLEMYKSSDGTPVHAIKVSGTDSLEIIAKFTVPDESDVASIFRICEVPSNFVLTAGNLVFDGGSLSTDVDLGLYETAEHGSAVILGDMFVDGEDVSSAGSVSALDNIAVDDLDQTFYELAESLGTDREDKSSSRQAYVIGLTLKVKSTGAGIFVLKLSLARKS